MRALPQEEVSIKAARRNIIEDLRSGDFTIQRLAFDRLSVLAENHFPYFPSVLPVAIGLIAAANHLDDRIRERLITPENQRVEIQQLIQAAVNLLNKKQAEELVGRIPLEKKEG